METLLIYRMLKRNSFIFENYVPSDDILMLAQCGSFEVNCQNRKITVRENEGMIFKKNVFYHRKITEPATLHLFRFKAESQPFGEGKVVFSDKGRIKSTMELLARIEKGVYKDDFELKTRLFLDVVTQYTLENLASSHSECGVDLIDHAVAVLGDSIHTKVHLPELAQRAGLSYAQFSRKFKERTGMSPSEYLFMLRIAKAKKLLLNSTLLIREIAEACGFENEYYFSNFFKKHTSRSPSEFRALKEDE